MSEINTLMTGGNFPPKLVSEMFDTVRGESSLAKLCAQTPIPFNGIKEFVFSMDGEASIVGEGEAKPAGKAAITPKVITPIKFVYQARVSDEFLYATEESQIQTLRYFSDGFAKKIAKGFDIAAMHGLNPATMSAASFAATNSFDGLVENVKAYDATKIDDVIEEAIASVRVTYERDVNGMAISPTVGSDLSKVKVNGVVQYPEFRFGQCPDRFANMSLSMNSTVSKAASGEDVDHVLVGDFQNAFKWGYAKNIPLEIIEYGDPDGAGRDLKRYNEICLRAEAYIGWGVLDADSFAIVNTATESDS